ncbi:dTDP-4-amino-4,6-dideoxygalactose transaminase [Gillisia mitskevichiae]|uniref:dTDP-4-amino-4,6-dideoxygalactose transaminase n=1 Tax=Gillisia mitskevichiae TaxID=270921 RepID=A0A495PL42_9FLAO|nr:DegT/DnrJ/EryC1/StrS family aminotransferase [Gillisia mitskevichiae]RKS50570.1 dTDP-4-amino-4,6-dideoxygalactose transaminase [Gillisia mitskevichiae]
MEQSKIWLSSPHMGGTEQKFVNEAFDANWIAPLGPNVTGFEIDIENYLSNSKHEETPVHVAALSSGTAALHLALILLDVKPNDEVICQSMTFAASANPIMYLGATPVFVDSEKDTLNLCPIQLEKAIEDRISKGKKPKAIIAVHLYGMPYKVDDIQQVADKFGIPIIEDSAEALGSSYKGRKCGTFGEIGVLSFNGNKIITTSGGGALIVNKKAVKQKAIFLATQARDDAPHYQHTEIGYNYRLSNISAGIGRGQMEVLDKHVNLRREMNLFYQDVFSNIEGVTVYSEPNDDYFCNNWLTIISVDENITGKNREEFRLYMEALNIECRPLWKPMHLQPVFKNMPFYGNGLAEELFESGLCLPSGSNLANQDRERLRTGINEFFGA